MVGGGAAVPTGLLVVAMSVSLEVIARDPVLRHRARAILLARGGVRTVRPGGHGRARRQSRRCRAVCSVLDRLDQRRSDYQAGFEICSATSLEHSLAYSGKSCLQRSREPGALTLYAGVLFGLYIAAGAMVSNFFFFISGSWLGLVGASQEETTAVRGISTPNILQTEETTDDP
jgi:hypothetical protein